MSFKTLFVTAMVLIGCKFKRIVLKCEKFHFFYLNTKKNRLRCWKACGTRNSQSILRLRLQNVFFFVFFAQYFTF